MILVNENCKVILQPRGLGYVCKPAQIEKVEMNTLLINGRYFQRWGDRGGGLVEVRPYQTESEFDDFDLGPTVEEFYYE